MPEAWNAGGPRVTGCHEPRQVRKEATVSGSVRVVSFSALHSRFLPNVLENYLVNSDALLAFQFDVFKRFPVAHAVFTRKGGVSPKPYDSLNVSTSVGDTLTNVALNLQKIRDNLKIGKIVMMNQVHGDNIHIVTCDHFSITPQADAVITNVPLLPLMIKQADCQGIIIYDPSHHAIGVVHCGWRGNALNLPGKVVAKMKEVYGSDPEKLIVAIGPSIGPCCAEYKDWKAIFPSFFSNFRVNTNHFDLKGITKFQLRQKGVLLENIYEATICTSCNTDLFYSHRKERITGRFATIAYLLPEWKYNSESIE